MAALAFLFAPLVHSDSDRVWHGYAYVAIAGTCLSITHPMRQALIANTVAREALGNAYAANVISITGTRLIGPLFWGILITSVGFFWAFSVESLFYAATARAPLPMKTPYAERTAGASRESPLANLKEGLMFVWRGERTIFNLILLGLIAELILHPVWYLVPVSTAEVLKRGADVGGILYLPPGSVD